MPIYYHCLKPFFPRGLQIALRRRIVLSKLSAYESVWPIDKAAGNPPQGWTGWPEGKRFALILTHDVEGPKGVERCYQLAALEENLGFRSSFNFVPKSCDIPQSLRHDLGATGFEVGVHGLCHDGNLFSSRRKFKRLSVEIDKYLREWQAVGFRTPSMYHNLDWVGELNVEYDCSTFDTDPFEPQPDGVRTIFPFLVQSSSASREYLELPYTLPQDFMLFVVMKEETSDIWKKKLDWIADKGGMALLITHPDYMNFGDGNCCVDEYPAGRYEEFLKHVKTKYEGQYWHVLPKELTRAWKEKLISDGV
jgi:hypothetical protein